MVGFERGEKLDKKGSRNLDLCRQAACGPGIYADGMSTLLGLNGELEGGDVDFG